MVYLEKYTILSMHLNYYYCCIIDYKTMLLICIKVSKIESHFTAKERLLINKLLINIPTYLIIRKTGCKTDSSL